MMIVFAHDFNDDDDDDCIKPKTKNNKKNTSP